MMTRHITRLFGRLSLVTRLMLAVALSFVATAAATLYLTTHYAAIATRNELAAEYDHERELLSRAVTPALLAHDAENLKITLDGLRGSPAVIRVSFRDVSDAVGFSRETPALLTAPRWFARLCGNQLVGGTQPLSINGVYFGLLTLDLSPIPAINLAWERTQRQMTILALALGLVFISIWLVLRQGLKPLQALARGARELRAGDYSIRLEAEGSPELRANIIEFNRMAVTLEAAQKRTAETLDSSQKQLQQQGSFAQALLKAQASAGICLAIVDGDKTISANKAALDVLGLKQEDLARTTIANMLDSRHRGDFDRQFQRVLRGEVLLSPRVELKLATWSGEERWMEVAIFGIARDDRRLIAVLGLDITRRKHDSQQLVKAHKTLRAQKEVAERANNSKTRFLAAASHDLRQPLHALALFSGRLRKLMATPEQQHLARQIDAAVDNVSEMLESLLDISKIDLATTRPDIRGIELQQLFEQVAASHQHDAEIKQLRLRFAPTSLRVSSDPVFLFRIVSNLAANAIRYTDHGAILIGARRAGDDARIEVWDTGIGVEEKLIPFLFQEFYQIGNAERDAKKGLGLGLAIVERLANILGHKIGVRSTPGAGSVFSVLVPRAKPEDMARDQQLAIKTDARIVFVTAQPGEQTELTLLLDRWGYSLSLCRPDEIGEAAAAIKPDLIISEQSCIDCLAKGRGTAWPETIPVICAMKEEALPENSGAQQLCSAHVVATKPAKLRALILHLLAQKQDNASR